MPYGTLSKVSEPELFRDRINWVTDWKDLWKAYLAELNFS